MTKFFLEKKIDLFEMSNLRMRRTGLPMCIYVSEKGNSKPGARIKVSQVYGDKVFPSKFFVLTVSENPVVIGDIGNIKEKDVSLVKNFIVDNLSLLLDLWEERIDIGELLDNLIKEE